MKERNCTTPNLIAVGGHSCALRCFEAGYGAGGGFAGWIEVTLIMALEQALLLLEAKL
jgi:hypothetical protein